MSQHETNQIKRESMIAAISSVVLHLCLVASMVSFSSLFSTELKSSSAENTIAVQFIESKAPAESIENRNSNREISPDFAARPKQLLPREQPIASVHTHEPDVDDGALAAEAEAFRAAGDQDASNEIRHDYVLRLRALIEKHKSYPVRARQMGISGRVIVSFTILENGRIADVHVSKPCHHNLLNESAIELIENISSFEPIPSQIGLSRWPMRVPIDFALNH